MFIYCIFCALNEFIISCIAQSKFFRGELEKKFYSINTFTSPTFPMSSKPSLSDTQSSAASSSDPVYSRAPSPLHDHPPTSWGSHLSCLSPFGSSYNSLVVDLGTFSLKLQGRHALSFLSIMQKIRLWIFIHGYVYSREVSQRCFCVFFCIFCVVY